jgi:hypothetical protein
LQSQTIEIKDFIDLKSERSEQSALLSIKSKNDTIKHSGSNSNIEERKGVDQESDANLVPLQPKKSFISNIIGFAKDKQSHAGQMSKS